MRDAANSPSGLALTGNEIVVNTDQNPQNSRLKFRKLIEWLFFSSFRGATLINALALFIIIYFMLVNGWEAISIPFLTEAPREAMTKGGILPCIAGTVYLAVGAMVFAFPIGIASAIYLNEYAKPGIMLRLIRIGINNLAGVPSVVFGLFGLAFFVTYFKCGVSILAGALTLGAMSLPVIIGTTEEALKSVSNTYREASLALGATKFQTIFKVVLPCALPGILTGGILGISRAAGETAPIMFTAAVFFTPSLPSSIFDEIMALPYHIYVLATAGTENRGDPAIAIRNRTGFDHTRSWLEPVSYSLPFPAQEKNCGNSPSRF